MVDIVERVAAALEKCYGESHIIELMWGNLARVALEAMREPLLQGMYDLSSDYKIYQGCAAVDKLITAAIETKPTSLPEEH